MMISAATHLNNSAILVPDSYLIQIVDLTTLEPIHLVKVQDLFQVTGLFYKITSITACPTEGDNGFVAIACEDKCLRLLTLKAVLDCVGETAMKK